MIWNIVNTISSRLIMAIISIVLLLINSNFLGADGLGTIGLLILGISLFVLISNIINGGSLVYYCSRYSIFSLMLVSYLWIFFLGILYFISLIIFPSFLGKYSWDSLYLSIILSVASTNSLLLLGKEEVKKFNLCIIIQSIVQMIGVLIFYFLMQKKSVDSFIIATYLGYLSHFLLGAYFIWGYLKIEFSIPFKTLFFKLFSYGFYLQLSNIFQLMNYRFSYYILQMYFGKTSVGIYSAGVQLSEGILLPAKSIAMVQYSRISNLTSSHEAANLTLRLIKVSLVLTLLLLLVLILLPGSFYVSFLGVGFENVKSVISAMSIGIIALSMETILGRYFSGTGKQKINTINTGIGTLATLIFGFWLIPKYKFIGAAITASIAYLSMLIFMIFMLKKNVKFTFYSFIPHQNDWKEIKEILRAAKQKIKK